jgi:hypothetical protein
VCRLLRNGRSREGEGVLCALNGDSGWIPIGGGRLTSSLFVRLGRRTGESGIVVDFELSLDQIVKDLSRTEYKHRG